MAISIVQTLAKTVASGVSSQANTSTWGSNVTAGNTIFVLIASNNTTGSGLNNVTSVTDNNGNTYNFQGSNKDLSNATKLWVEVWEAQNVTGGAKPTITVHLAASSNVVFGALEVAGLGALPGFDVITGNGNASATTTAPTAGTYTTVQAAELAIVGIITSQSGDTFSAEPAGFGSQIQNGPTVNCDFATQIYSSTQSGVTPTWTLGVGASYCSLTVTYYSNSSLIFDGFLTGNTGFGSPLPNWATSWPRSAALRMAADSLYPLPITGSAPIDGHDLPNFSQTPDRILRRDGLPRHPDFAFWPFPLTGSAPPDGSTMPNFSQQPDRTLRPAVVPLVPVVAPTWFYSSPQGQSPDISTEMSWRGDTVADRTRGPTRLHLAPDESQVPITTDSQQYFGWDLPTEQVPQHHLRRPVLLSSDRDAFPLPTLDAQIIVWDGLQVLPTRRARLLPPSGVTEPWQESVLPDPPLPSAADLSAHAGVRRLFGPGRVQPGSTDWQSYPLAALAAEVTAWDVPPQQPVPPRRLLPAGELTGPGDWRLAMTWDAGQTAPLPPARRRAGEDCWPFGQLVEAQNSQLGWPAQGISPLFRPVRIPGEAVQVQTGFLLDVAAVHLQQTAWERPQQPRRLAIVDVGSLVVAWLTDVPPWAELVQDQRILPRPGSVRDTSTLAWLPLPPAYLFESVLAGLPYPAFGSPRFVPAWRPLGDAAFVNTLTGPASDITEALLVQQLLPMPPLLRRPGPDAALSLLVPPPDALPWNALLVQPTDPCRPVPRRAISELAWTPQTPLDAGLETVPLIQPAVLVRRAVQGLQAIEVVAWPVELDPGQLWDVPPGAPVRPARGQRSVGDLVVLVDPGQLWDVLPSALPRGPGVPRREVGPLGLPVDLQDVSRWLAAFSGQDRGSRSPPRLTYESLLLLVADATAWQSALDQLAVPLFRPAVKRAAAADAGGQPFTSVLDVLPWQAFEDATPARLVQPRRLTAEDGTQRAQVWPVPGDLLWPGLLDAAPPGLPRRPRVSSEGQTPPEVWPVPDDVSLLSCRADTVTMRPVQPRRQGEGLIPLAPIAESADWLTALPPCADVARLPVRRPGESRDEAAVWQQAATLAGDLWFSAIHAGLQLPAFPRRQSRYEDKLPPGQAFVPLPESLVQCEVVSPRAPRWTPAQATIAAVDAVGVEYTLVVLVGQYYVVAQDGYFAGAVTGDAVED